MSTRDRMNSASIAPGAILKTEYFNIGSANSIEYNVDQELTLMAEHLAIDFVVTIPTFNDGDFEGGYVAGNALEVSRNTGNTSNIDIKPGISWIGGRRYKQVNTISDYNLSGITPATLHYIRLKYTYSTAQFTFIAETSISSDSDTVKYLSLASATWNTGGTFWDDDFTDMRATNTALPTPVAFIGAHVSDYVLTVRNTSSRLATDIDGYLRVGTPSTDGQISLYGKDATEGLTIYNNSGSYSALISANNTDQIFIDDKLEVDTTITVGSTTIQSASIAGITSFTFGASPSLTTASGDFNWNSENFGSVGTIGSGAITSTGVVQGTRLTSTIAIGTAPLTVTSTTKVDNLNVDKVDDYDFDQPLLQASTPTFGSVSITSGPTISATGIAGASGDTITGFMSLSVSGAITAATSTDTINGLVISAGSITTGVWSGTAIADAQVADNITLTNITQITNRAHADLSNSGTKTHSEIDTHIGTTSTHFTQGSITTVGTVTSGTWSATAIINARLASFGTSAQLDQDCRASSGPLFGAILLDGSTSASSTDGRVTLGQYADGIRFTEPSAGALGGESFSIYTRTAPPSGWVIDSTGTYAINFGEDIRPLADATYDCGASSYSWDYVYAQHLRYDIDSLAYDHLDDLAIIDALGPNGKKDPETGNPMMDNSALPDGVRGEDGFIDAHNYTSFLAGGIKQLHTKVKEQDELIGVLMDKIEELEARMDAS